MNIRDNSSIQSSLYEHVLRRHSLSFDRLDFEFAPKCPRNLSELTESGKRPMNICQGQVKPELPGVSRLLHEHAQGRKASTPSLSGIREGRARTARASTTVVQVTTSEHVHTYSRWQKKSVQFMSEVVLTHCVLITQPASCTPGHTSDRTREQLRRKLACVHPAHILLLAQILVFNGSKW